MDQVPHKELQRPAETRKGSLKKENLKQGWLRPENWERQAKAWAVGGEGLGGWGVWSTEGGVPHTCSLGQGVLEAPLGS